MIGLGQGVVGGGGVIRGRPTWMEEGPAWQRGWLGRGGARRRWRVPGCCRRLMNGAPAPTWIGHKISTAGLNARSSPSEPHNPSERPSGGNLRCPSGGRQRLGNGTWASRDGKGWFTGNLDGGLGLRGPHGCGARAAGAPRRRGGGEGNLQRAQAGGCSPWFAAQDRLPGKRRRSRQWVARPKRAAWAIA